MDTCHVPSTGPRARNATGKKLDISYLSWSYGLVEEKDIKQETNSNIHCSTVYNSQDMEAM